MPTYAYLPFIKVFPVRNKLGDKPFSAYKLGWPLEVALTLAANQENTAEFREKEEDYIVYRVEASMAKRLLQGNFQSAYKLSKRLEKMAREGNAFLHEERFSSDIFNKRELLWRYGKPELEYSGGKYKALILHDTDIIIPIYAVPIEGQAQDIKHSKPYSLAEEWLKKFNIEASLSIATMRKSDVRVAGCTKTSSKLGGRILESLPSIPISIKRFS